MATELTRAELKSVWVKGYRPKQADYSNLFDSVYIKASDEVSGSGVSSWNDLTDKPNVVLTVNGVSADQNGNVTVSSTPVSSTPVSSIAWSNVTDKPEIKYFKSGVLSTSTGTYQKTIPFTFTLSKVSFTLNVLGATQISVKKNGNEILNQTMSGYYEEVANTTSFVAGDYITIDIQNTTTAEDLTIEFYGTKG